MASKIVVRDGVARSVYDDRFAPIYAALGRGLDVERASDVEYEGGAWVARLRDSGRVISAGPSRAAVIAAEVAYLEGVL